ncbi:MAG: glutathione peroxidase [Bdellovibrionales bacterium]
MSIHQFTAKDISGREISLGAYKGKYMLIVNVASKCGFTPQYKGLETMFRELKNDLVVLGFPCNQFGAQEPGDENEIKDFCSLSYDITFPMFAKVDVNGQNTHPIYKFLKGEKPGLLGTEAIKWNFTKFLVDRDGNVVKRYAPNDPPEKISDEIKCLR